MAENFSIYSLADVIVTINHPEVGQCVISEQGGGRVVISRTGNLSTHTITATGYVVINKMRAVSGNCALELPQNSPADEYFRKLIRHLVGDATNNYALTTMDIFDPFGNDGRGKTFHLKGVTPDKWPDEAYDRESATRNYNMLAAEITEI